MISLINDVSNSLKIADEINQTPSKELIVKVTLDPKYANDLLTQFDNDSIRILACEQRLREARKLLAKALSLLS